MTTEKEQLEAEIAQRDERIAELEGLMAWQAKAIQEEREAYAMSMKDLQTSAVHLLFDGPPGPECGRFVEAEDPTGKSINAGEWSQRPDGYWQLVIQQPSAGVVDERAAFERHFKSVGSLTVNQLAHARDTDGMPFYEHLPTRIAWSAWQARARLNPCRAQSVPDGWVMVPAVATDHMTWVGQSMRHDTEISIGSIYCAMLAAAPYAQQKESGDE